jgi:DNA-directed RNA polymerase subunit RPC12/RpoP
LEGRALPLGAAAERQASTRDPATRRSREFGEGRRPVAATTGRRVFGRVDQRSDRDTEMKRPKSNWNECCPTCGKKIDLREAFSNRDYESEFVTECPDCEHKMRVFVYSVPEFEVLDDARYSAYEQAQMQAIRQGVEALEASKAGA